MTTMSLNKKPGLFISVEGADGSGKTSMISHIKTQFEKQGLTVTTTREPGGTWIAEAIRRILVDEDPAIESIDPAVQTLLLFAARLQHLKRMILPKLMEGQVVITDRYLDSTAVYQGILRDQSLLIDQMRHLSVVGFTSVRPDYTFFLDVSLEVSKARCQARGGNNLDKINNEFDLPALYRQHFQVVTRSVGADRIKTIDANRSVGEVQTQVDRDCEEIAGHRYSSLSAPGHSGFAYNTSGLLLSNSFCGG
jgi:dTMP kinase